MRNFNKPRTCRIWDMKEIFFGKFFLIHLLLSIRVSIAVSFPTLLSNNSRRMNDRIQTNFHSSNQVFQQNWIIFSGGFVCNWRNKLLPHPPTMYSHSSSAFWQVFYRVSRHFTAEFSGSPSWKCRFHFPETW